MCVTNTTQGRVQAVSFTAAQMGVVTPSILSQRLIGTFGYQANLPVVDSVKPFTFDEELIHSTAPNKSHPPKRRRKPQKPGKTAKHNDRHFVKHDYHDHSNDADDDVSDNATNEDPHRRRGGSTVSFPNKLHAVLLQVESDGLSNIVSWMPHGRCFVIHKPKEFVDLIMPKYFRQSKLTSFQRQLNLYGFQRLTRGTDAGGYYHEYFLRGKEFLCKRMTRTKVKGTKYKAASSPEQEPDFYDMTPILSNTVTPHTSDEELTFDSLNNSGQTYSMFPSQMHTNTSYNMFPSQPDSQLFSLSRSHAQPTPPPLMVSFQDSCLPVSYADTFDTYASWTLPVSEADRVLDEAVDELFMHGAQEVDTLSDFCHDWDPSNLFTGQLENDLQLGHLLDKLFDD